MANRRALFSFVFALLVGSACADLDGLSGGAPDGGALPAAHPDASATDGSSTTDAPAEAATGGGGDTGASDASGDVIVPPPPVGCDGGPASCAIPVPFSLVAAYVGAMPNACPQPFTSAGTFSASPVVGAGACDCASPAVGTPPSCTDGTAQFKYDTSAAAVCDTGGVAVMGMSGACAKLEPSVNLSPHVLLPPLPATNGTCTAAAKADLGKVTKTSVLLCKSDACSSELCANQPPLNADACIVATGDIACPAGSPFKKKTLIGTDVDLACSACGCAASATCTGAMIELFKDVNCGNSILKMPVNQCTAAAGETGSPIRSYKYSATATNISFTATGPKTATATLKSVQTLCCQ